MAKILDSTNITGNLQKVVETPLGYIINGAYYDKNQMIPKPLQVFPALGDIEDLSMSQKLMLNHSRLNHGKTVGDTIVTDRDDPSICYVWVIGTRSNGPRLFKLKEKDGSVAILASKYYSGSPNTYPMIRAYAGQDSTYIYYIISTQNGSYYTEYLVKIEKKSLDLTSIENNPYSWMNPIKETDTYIYYGRIYQYGRCYITRYNKISGSFDSIANTYKSTDRYFRTCFSDLLTISDSEFINFSLFCSNSTGFTIVKHHYDIEQLDKSKIHTATECNITWGEDITELPLLGTTNNASYYTYFTYEPFITTIDNNKYLNIAVYMIPGYSSSSYIKDCGIYTFLIEPDTEDLIFKSFIKVTDEYFRGFLGIKNNTFLVATSDNTCYFMNFDKQKEQFVITDSLSNKPWHIGIDQSENIWIMNSLYEVEMLTPFVPTNVNIDYESHGYQYKGEDIHTYITIEAKNYNDVNIASDLQLTIKGNAVFYSNGTKTLSDTTLTTGVKYIPIIIKGAGAVTVYPQLIM